MKNSKVSLGMIILSIIALAIITSVYFTIVNTSVIDFAGFKWDIETNNYHDTIPTGSCSGSASKNNEIMQLNINVGGSSAGAGCRVTATTQLPISDIDEFLVIFDSTLSRGNQMGATAGFFLTDKMRIDTSRDDKYLLNQLITYQDNTGTLTSIYHEPKIIKLKNNFDGTYSILSSLGVGDIFILKERKSIPPMPLYLSIFVDGAGGANGDFARAEMNIYNIVRKENAFAICKANKYPFDANKDGKIATDGTECFDLNTIFLNSEEAIKESFNEKLTRITAELEAKNVGLTADINNLKIQLAAEQSKPAPTIDLSLLNQQISNLQSELKATKTALNAVKAGDTTVINVISAQEQFKEPNFFARMWNSIIAFFKNLF